MPANKKRSAKSKGKAPAHKKVKTESVKAGFKDLTPDEALSFENKVDEMLREQGHVGSLEKGDDWMDRLAAWTPDTVVMDNLGTWTKKEMADYCRERNCEIIPLSRTIREWRSHLFANFINAFNY